MVQRLAAMIDHTLLHAAASKEEILLLCREAEEYQFAAVCVNPTWVTKASEQLKNSNVKVCTVIGFPLGATTTEVKVYEAIQAVDNGALEVDMVINVGALKEKCNELVKADIKKVVEAVKGRAITKVIIETGLLTDEEKIIACQLAAEAGADFVKTSTGFAEGGATIEDVKLMRSVVGPSVGVKASGGIRTLEDALAMIEAGATRIGASAGVRIVNGEKANTNY